jgi:peroxiredoxin Q/BCP
MMKEQVTASHRPTLTPTVMNSVKAGDKAPEFTTPDDTGARISLSEFKGKWVVLFFYPKDDSPG